MELYLSGLVKCHSQVSAGAAIKKGVYLEKKTTRKGIFNSQNKFSTRKKVFNS